MKYVYLFMLSFLSNVVLSPFLFSQSRFSVCQETEKLVDLMEALHYQPIELDQDASEQIFNRFLTQIDPLGLYFTIEEIAYLEPLKADIQGILIGSDCSIIEEMNRMFEAGLRRAEQIVGAMAAQQLNFQASDSIRLRSDELPQFARDNESLKNRWVSLLKYQVLLRLQYAESPDQSLFQDEAIQKMLCRISRKKAHPLGLNGYLGERLLNAIAIQYDPHSLYMLPAHFQSFASSMTKDALSFGLEFREDANGNILIDHLIPGGPAWRSNSLHAGDQLLGIQFADGETLDLLCMYADEVSEKLSSSTSLRVSFEVQKRNGQVEVVDLVKEKMAVEENVIDSFILNGERKVGYIYLPGFYTNWEEKGALGCANDLAKELLKLQLEGIEGLILDLRNNGGGSVREALGLAGIFIDEGPLTIESDYSGKTVSLKDRNRGSSYDGPLVVMVNGASASASEIFAAAMQDYRRALIVGDTTFGKSTGQMIVPLSDLRDAAMVKYTGFKYYRLNQQSHQKVGVAPDISLPSLWGSVMPSEKDYPTALASGQTDKQISFKAANPLPRESLAFNSHKRQKRSTAFQQISLLADSLKQSDQMRSGYISLNQEDFAMFYAAQTRLLERSETISQNKSQAFEVDNNRYAKNLIQIDPYRKELNQQLLTSIQEDLYIEEAYFILTDFIPLYQP